MNNITQIRPTVRKTIQTHLITISLMPKNVQEDLMQAALAVGFLFGNCEYELSENASQITIETFENLERAVKMASLYTVPSEREVDEPV